MTLVLARTQARLYIFPSNLVCRSTPSEDDLKVGRRKSRKGRSEHTVLLDSAGDGKGL